MPSKGVVGIAASAAFLGLALLAVLSVPIPEPPANGGGDAIGDFLWSERSVEVIVQAFVLLCGAFAIGLLIPVRGGEANG
jgi:hypothetical protein